MRQVQLKTVEIVLDGKTSPLSYKLQLAHIMRTPSQNTADLDEVRRSIRILNALDTIEGNVLNLEDADFEYMCQRVTGTRWPFIDPVIITFVDDVTGAK